MSVVLALFIALTAGASENEPLLPPVEDAPCAVQIANADVLDDIVARLRTVGVEQLLRSYDDQTLLVRSPWRFQSKRIGLSRTAKKRVLVLGQIPYATEEERLKATRQVANALYRLELSARPRDNAPLQVEVMLVNEKLRPATPEKVEARKPRLLRYAAGTTALIAIVGTGVWFSNDIAEGTRYVITEAGKFNPWRTEPTEQQRVETQMRELERFINKEENKIGRADQVELARKRNELGELYQRYPELRRQSSGR